MAGGSIVAGLFKEPYDIKDLHTKLQASEAILSLATVAIFMIGDPFRGLVYSQMFLSIQLPITIFLQIYLTSSAKVMGQYRNSTLDQTVLWMIGIVVTVLNLMLLKSYF